jgi:O-6-methylguanine DNA methyltransferase
MTRTTRTTRATRTTTPDRPAGTTRIPDPVIADDTPGALTTLATRAPAHLADDVLVEVGLVDRMAPYPSPIGTLFIAWNGRGVAEVDLGPDGDEARARHEARSGRRTVLADALPAALADAIARRLAGERRVRIPLDLRGRTEFEVAVWTKALEIPRGEVRPYGWIAAEIGRPKAVRAVGTALGHNPVPLIVPCHRVVRTDGTIGQYSLGGPGNKRTILAAEGLDPEELEGAARRGERLSGSTTTRIVCWPTCRHARRTQQRYRVAFRSLREAGAMGYRPCKVCRPTVLEPAA